MRVLILDGGSVGRILANMLEGHGVEVVDAAELEAAPASPTILGVLGYSARRIAEVLEFCASPSIADWDYPDKILDYLPISVIVKAPHFVSAPRHVPSWENYKRVLWVHIGL